MTDQNKKLIEGLEQRLLWYREEVPADEFDADEVDAICTMLLKLSPESKPRRTAEEAYQNILRRIDLEEEDPEREEAEEYGRANKYGRVNEKKPEKYSRADEKEPGRDGGKKKILFGPGKRGLRAAIIFLAAVGIFASLNTVTYARENKSLFTMILERVGWLQIEKEQRVEDSMVATEILTDAFYDSWGDLDREVKERITVPAYIPEGYSLYGIRCWNREDEKIIRSNYYDQGNGHLLVHITLWEDNADHYRETLMDETTYTLLSEYSDGNTFYYEYEGEYICQALGEKIFYRISGNISLEEMIKIREGLGEIIR